MALKEIIAAGAVAVGFPAMTAFAFAEAAGAALGRWQADQLAIARATLARQMARGDIWKISEDEAAAALFTYLNAAQEGAARNNLEAMAEAIVTEALEPTLTAHVRRRHFTNLASLSLDEIMVLAAFIRAQSEWEASAPHSDDDQDLWFRVKNAHVGQGRAFAEKDALKAVCSALLRTGYLQLVTYYGGSIGFLPTGQLVEVSRLVDLDAAMARAQGV